MKNAKRGALLATVLTLTLTACATPGSNLIVDGPRSYNWDADLAACRDLSLQRRPNHAITAAGAAVGGVVGAADADKGDEGKDALTGMAVGALLGGTKAQIDAHKARKKIVADCMRGRGHKVVG